jgi:phosphatidylcholine synthase
MLRAVMQHGRDESAEGVERVAGREGGLAAASDSGRSPLRIALAYGVHLFTASGALAGLLALLTATRDDLRAAALWMLAAMAVDSVDGTLARAVGVRRVLPGIDGRRLDDVVDFFNYVLVPAVFLVAGGYLVHAAWAALPVLASAYGFSHEKAKTDDGFFLGFPSYWNVIGIFAWLLEVSAPTCTAFVALFSVLVFVPLKYVYPSYLRVLKRTTAVLTAIAAAVVVYAIFEPERGRALYLLARIAYVPTTVLRSGSAACTAHA